MSTYELGQGAYTPAEASRLADLDPSRVRRWTFGYSWSDPRSGERRASPALVNRERPRRLLNFLDLLEIRFVKEFLDHGVTLHTVRLVQQEAAGEFGTAHPFCVKRFETDGKTILERFVDRGIERMLDRKRKQTVSIPIFNTLLRQIDYEGLSKEAKRWYPLGRDGLVVLDPARSFGEALVATGGVPTRSLFAAHLAGEPDQAIARWFDVTLEEVRAAIAFEARMKAKQHAA